MSGTLDHRQHVYHNEEWQTLEVRKEVGGTEDSDPLEQYVWHPHYIDAIVLRDYDPETDGSSTRYYSTQDANFNVTAVTNSSGTVVERYTYSPYGELLVLDANFATDADGLSDIGNSVTYTGREFDAESGLYHYRNRFYHAQAGLFISRDSLAYLSGLDLYLYVSAEPTNDLDPSGNLSLKICLKRLNGADIHVREILDHHTPNHCNALASILETFLSGGCRRWNHRPELDILIEFWNEKCHPKDPKEWPKKPRPYPRPEPIPIVPLPEPVRTPDCRHTQPDHPWFPQVPPIVEPVITQPQPVPRTVPRRPIYMPNRPIYVPRIVIPPIYWPDPNQGA